MLKFMALLAACVSLGVLASSAVAADPASTDLCVGLECDVPASGSYVPEAHGAVPAVSGLDELTAQKSSGFYELPALVYRGDVQPRAVVYLAKAGEFDRMPASVRNLVAVQDFLRVEGPDAATLVVVDHGIRIVVPSEARPARARAASPAFCYDRYFCLFTAENYLGTRWEFPGASYAGTGWHNLGTNVGAAQVNNRGGDTLLADHGMGDGTRYCAIEWSFDSTFSNNAIGNGNASSIALLGSTPDRC